MDESQHEPDSHRQTGGPEPSGPPPDLESVREVLEAILRINERIHRLTLDYALIAAIIAALPSRPWLLEVQLAAVVILNALLVRGIGARWGFPRGQGPLTVTLAVFSLLGAVVLMVAAYLVIYSASLYLPLVRSWATAGAYFALTLAVGRTANDYFLSARRINPRRIRLALRRRRRDRRRRRGVPRTEEHRS